MRRITVRTVSDGSYTVTVGDGLAGAIRTFVQEMNEVRRVAVITDSRVAELHLAALRAAVPLPLVEIVFAAGEGSKTLQTYAQVLDGLAEGRIERSDLIVTFGGGVAGDLGGFAAATWLRGVRYVQVPTTVEAAVDASVGGKTGVNHPSGKNLIGAFHQPSAVFIDVAYLRTLALRDYVAGLAESVKHAVVRDPSFLTWQDEHAVAIEERDAETVEELIARNVAIKAGVVEADEREARLRMILNHGHTIGHAIEHAAQYSLRHGECVALGMIVENEIAVRRGLLPAASAERIRGVLSRLGLPCRLPTALSGDAIVDATGRDKKRRGGHDTFVLLREIGEPVWASDVTREDVLAAVEVVAPVPG